MIRIILGAIAEGAIKLFSGTGRPGESFTGREYFQHYGFTSSPLPGAEGILVNKGNHIVLIATDDRRYRIALEGGEVAIYTDEGDHVHLKRGRVAEIVTETLVIKAGTKVRIETPQVEATGEIVDRVDSDGRSMEQMRTTYDAHTHKQVQPGTGNSGVPNQGM
ncbi:MAG: phage baseplate assembly protein [Desulfobulbus sp.]|jgi:phage gp45-like|uniref:phage baseplate assembly protein domain-containing protein n=1 Tax=Desulfobulbus sp. TaxID=895 RepID=UPI00283F116E|nr:phage baseplate assembly protein [Desulfobulbus sp.]MDR2551460.1 phage baseplate assembly protein [Desulfobulbus sp.]